MNPLSSSTECISNKHFPTGNQASCRQLGALVGHLHNLPTQHHWIFADQLLLLAVAKGERVVRGVFGSRLGNLVKLSQHLWLVWPLLSLVGIVELLKLLFRQRASLRNSGDRNKYYPECFFVGFGAGAEDELFKRYRENHRGDVKKLNQIEVGSLAAWHSVGIVSGLRALIYALKLARMAITNLPSELAPWRADFLTYIGMRIGYFAYMRAWFGFLKKKAGTCLTEVAFLAADTAAFAAVDAGLPTCYVQHGLLPYSALLPKFTRVEALTVDEADFMRRSLPNANITMCPRQKFTLSPSQMKKEVLITSIYGTADYMAGSITPFLSWATGRQLPIRVRPHPCETSTFWSDYEANGAVIIEKDDISFLQSIDRLRPRLNISWFSTTLADALEYGVIPVTVCADDDSEVLNTVYPLFKRCLRWPQDADIMERLLDDDEYYASVWSRLREGLNEIGA